MLTIHNYAGPSITSGVTVISTYTSSAESAELNEVLVQLEHVVSIKCISFLRTNLIM